MKEFIHASKRRYNHDIHINRVTDDIYGDNIPLNFRRCHMINRMFGTRTWAFHSNRLA